MAEPGKGQAKEPAMRIDAKLVQELAELLEKNGLTEIEVADGERRIKVGRALTATAPAPAPAPAATSGKASPAIPPAEEIAGEIVKSPMVGTAFLSPEPGADPF